MGAGCARERYPGLYASLYTPGMCTIVHIPSPWGPAADGRTSILGRSRGAADGAAGRKGIGLQEPKEPGWSPLAATSQQFC